MQIPYMAIDLQSRLNKDDHGVHTENRTIIYRIVAIATDTIAPLRPWVSMTQPPTGAKRGPSHNMSPKSARSQNEMNWADSRLNSALY